MIGAGREEVRLGGTGGEEEGLLLLGGGVEEAIPLLAASPLTLYERSCHLLELQVGR